MIRVTADTNIYISALLFGGLPGSFLDLALAESFMLITSAPILDELDEKLRIKFRMTETDAIIVRRKLEGVADLVTPTQVIDAIKDDPDDNRVLECAVEGHADYIVTGDHHLLTLGSFHGISLLTVRRFLDAIDSGEPNR